MAAATANIVGGSRVRVLMGELASRNLRKLNADGKPMTVGQCFNEAAHADSLKQAQDRLQIEFCAPLRDIFACADGQKHGTPPVLVVPKNRAVSFLSLRQARDLALFWREQVTHPVNHRWWSGYNTDWIPIGFASKFSVALCVSARVGRVVRFTTPEAEASHTVMQTQHLAENLEDYLVDLDDHVRGVRQPFFSGPKTSSHPAQLL